ncbi:hemerythrin domain-containing protein [Novosphingobium sp. G106]|uniref:hemerythrin domain-containing protein n=1 Tax=Novosphingobium sp. G106 TaxID=2849500 RepID=UPI001C2CED16|nr:hemerythrin domain-containing protein [Novosphingobium sp. G106]MBV1688437.1 hemerythrin domain-containing protein [Novosphingobium sp. G106]
MADKQTDAIALLKADHRAVKELFEKFDATDSKSKQKELATQICTELVIHTTIEEEIFYPALKGKIEDDLLNESYVEHDGAKLLIGQIMAGEPGEEFYEAKVTVLSEEIAHHVEEEEAPKDGMFAQARDSDVDLVALGAAMEARKEELKAQFKTNGIPTPTARTLKPVEIELGEPVACPSSPGVGPQVVGARRTTVTP